MLLRNYLSLFLTAINFGNDEKICFLFLKNWRRIIKTWPRFAWIEKTAVAAWWKAEYPEEWLMLTHLTRVSLAIHQFFNLHSAPVQPSHPSVHPSIIDCFHPRRIYWGLTGGVVEVDCRGWKCFPSIAWTAQRNGFKVQKAEKNNFSLQTRRYRFAIVISSMRKDASRH